MTRSDLLEVVYRFYPRGLLPGEPGYDDTEEHRRQVEAAHRGAVAYPTWKALLDRLEARYQLVDYAVCLLAGWCVPAYSGFVVIPGHTLGFHVSLLGPYYGIHRRGAPGEEPAALDLAREIEASYPGYEPIPPELGNELAPEVGVPGDTTIYYCLLSDVWEPSSGPLPPPDAPGTGSPAPGDRPEPGADGAESAPPVRGPRVVRLR